MQVSRHSTYVDLRLRVEGCDFALAQVGPDFVVFRRPVELPACEALLTMSVDGIERTEIVQLVDGTQPFDTSARIR